ncbi:DNA replication terminus site-binding protein [Aliamphritea spongicola]|uniref:DNA replication terminus site-binding protein n=1 Tax=Aliamphritea spongicola TaxID=707589 RepID=UPI00196B1F76|nr:DNA replication terminus site-binding protein [Aliamphritea spongicola]MBN3560619.1 DNA replication terminus site-binding protein [Aliamphritea spongicola]
MAQTPAYELIEALDTLLRRLNAFSAQLCHSKLPFWLPDEQICDLPSCAALFNDIWYRDGQDGRVTRTQHGLIGADKSLIEKALSVNAAKQAFQTLATHHRLSQDSDLQNQLTRRESLLAETLQHHGYSRIHLRQCYRQIPIIEGRPVKIGFSWYTSGRSIKQLTPEQALQRLQKMDTSQTHIQMQIDALGHLMPGDMLAQLQSQVPVMRANLLWKQNDQMIRKAQNVSLPMLIPLQPGETLPEHNQPLSSPPEQRSRSLRSDLKIDPVPFLPSLRVHKYIN